MSSDWRPRGADERVSDEQLPLPQDDFADEALVAEMEPQADGSPRVILYPPGGSDQQIAQQWLAVSADVVVSLADVR